MTANPVKDLLTEYAGQARHYDVGGRALVLGRRRRRIRRTLPAVLAAVGVLVAAIAVPALTGDRNSLPGYPAEVVPSENPPPLPPLDEVGRGLLVYERVGRQPVLVTVDGHEYLLPQHSSAKLSPDGRWLTFGDSSDTIVRDLTADGAKWILPGSLLAWSPDAHWFALGNNRAGSPSPGQINLFDTTSMEPTAMDLSRFTGQWRFAIRNSGDPVLVTGAGPDFDVITVERATGQDREGVALELAPHLTAQERVGRATEPDALVVTADDRMLVRTYGRNGDPDRPADVLAVDLNTMAVQRWRLPEPSATERWELLGVVPEGLLLLHRRANRLAAIELHATPDGPTSKVTDLSRLPAT